MKILRVNEMKTIKSSELKNWSIIDTNSNYINIPVNIDIKLGQTVKDLLTNNNIGLSIDNKNFLTPYHLLPNEKNYKEYRITLTKIRTELEVLDNYGYKSIDEITDEKEKKEILSEIDKEINFEENVTFSAFLSTSINSNNLEFAALDWASKYLKIIYTSFPNIIKSDIAIEDSLINNVENFKKFVSLHNIKINNDNLEILPDINYRIYKDSKFFYNLGYEIGKNKAEQLFIDWLKLIK